jgi:hypothetical protein
MSAPPDDRETAREIVSQVYGNTASEENALIDMMTQALHDAREEGRREGAREMREAAAHVGDDYGRDGSYQLEYGCEVADELAARIRSLPLPGDTTEETG